MGCAVLPHLKSLVEIVEGGLDDDQQKVRTITALCLAALAEASAPYGIEAFDSVLKPLWKVRLLSLLLKIIEKIEFRWRTVREFHLHCISSIYIYCVLGYPSASRKGSCSVPQGYRLPHSSHGRRVCELLY